MTQMLLFDLPLGCWSLFNWLLDSGVVNSLLSAIHTVVGLAVFMKTLSQWMGPCPLSRLLSAPGQQAETYTLQTLLDKKSLDPKGG